MKCVHYVNLFDTGPKNRRRTPKEMEEEKWLCKIFKRPPTEMVLDPPFYPWLPPEPYVNFKLNFTE